MEAYITLITAVQAVQKANAANATAIRDALKQLDLRETPFGSIKFDPTGQNQHPVLITQVQGGQYKVVWPPEAADAKPIIPTPRWNQR